MKLWVLPLDGPWRWQGKQGPGWTLELSCGDQQSGPGTSPRGRGSGEARFLRLCPHTQGTAELSQARTVRCEEAPTVSLLTMWSQHCTQGRFRSRTFTGHIQTFAAVSPDVMRCKDFIHGIYAV